MGEKRQQAQTSVLNQFINSEVKRFYTLEMPTGYGKTVTALKLATKLGEKKKVNKVLYVAP